MVLLAVLATTGLGILLGYLAKTPCTGPPYDAFGISANLAARKYSDLCYSDVQQLWVGRGVREHLFPYLQGRLVPSDEPQGQLVDGAVEYPVVTGVFMWFAGLGAADDGDYLRTTALLLAPFGLLTAVAAGQARRAAGVHLGGGAGAGPLQRAQLGLPGHRLRGRGRLRLVPRPARRRRDAARPRRGHQDLSRLPRAAAAAGAARAAGLPRRRPGGRRHRRRLGGDQPAVACWPTPGGWWATYAFQAGRAADLTTNSIWYWGFPDLDPDQVNRWSAALIAASWMLALVVGWAIARSGPGATRGSRSEPRCSCSFLLFNKVYSPQYVLWLLPFFVLVRLRWGWWAAYLAVDLLLYVGLFRWYYDITLGGDFGLAKQAAVLGVWGKAVLLALLYVVFLTSRLAIAGPESGASSSTPPAGSSSPAARTRSCSGRSTSRTTSARARSAPRPAAAPRTGTSRSRRPCPRCRGTTAAAAPRPGTR